MYILGHVDEYYSRSETARITGATKRQLQHWDGTGLIVPRFRCRKVNRLYTFMQILEIKIVMFIRGYGVSIQQADTILPQIRAVLSEFAPSIEPKYTVLVHGNCILAFPGRPIVRPVLPESFVDISLVHLFAEIRAQTPVPHHARVPADNPVAWRPLT